MIEVLKQALDALYPISHNSTDDYRGRADKAISFLLKAISDLESQEPVGEVKDLFTQAAWERIDVRGSTKVYLNTTPQRTWVGLTDEDRDLIVGMSCKKDSSYSDSEKVAQAIEAKLKEKNT